MKDEFTLVTNVPICDELYSILFPSVSNNRLVVRHRSVSTMDWHISQQEECDINQLHVIFQKSSTSFIIHRFPAENIDWGIKTSERIIKWSGKWRAFTVVSHWSFHSLTSRFLNLILHNISTISAGGGGSCLLERLLIFTLNIVISSKLILCRMHVYQAMNTMVRLFRLI
jgi:hypothetical protein